MAAAQEEPKVIEVWRHPFEKGETPYYFLHAHFGYDDVRNRALPTGVIQAVQDPRDGWVSWTVPDNSQNRRLIREGWGSSMYTVIFPDDVPQKPMILEKVKKEYVSKLRHKARMALEEEAKAKASKLESEEAELAKRLADVRAMRELNTGAKAQADTDTAILPSVSGAPEAEDQPFEEAEAEGISDPEMVSAPSAPVAPVRHPQAPAHRPAQPSKPKPWEPRRG
jgi:hypothetical protein